MIFSKLQITEMYVRCMTGDDESNIKELAKTLSKKISDCDLIKDFAQFGIVIENIGYNRFVFKK